MKTSKLEIEWLEKEDRRKSLRASVCRDGKLHLGKSLRAKLPRSIRVGFDHNALTLVLADGHGDGMDCPACGVLSIQTLSSRISSTGLRLPVPFLMAEDAQTGYLLGRIVPRRHANDDGKLCYDMEQLLILFRPMVDEVVHQLGKSTPLAELEQKFAGREIRLILGSYFDVPFGREVYDAAVSVESLHHFTKEEKLPLYRKLYRALKHGGYFILTDYFAESGEEEAAFRAELLRLKALQGISDGAFYHFDTPLTVEHEMEALSAAGFTSIEVLRHWGATYTIKAVKC